MGLPPQSPSLHQGEDPINPGQHDVRPSCNHARIVPVAGQSWIRGMAVGQQCAARFYVGSYESLDRGRRVVGDHREADAARTGVEIFRVIASRFGPMGVAFNHLDSADDEDFAGVAGLEKRIVFTERHFGLIDLDDVFEKFAIRINHRAPQLLRQQPSRSVGEAELMRPVSTIRLSLTNSDLTSLTIVLRQFIIVRQKSPNSSQSHHPRQPDTPARRAGDRP